MRELSNWWFGICGGYKSKESDVLIVIIFLKSSQRKGKLGADKEEESTWRVHSQVKRFLIFFYLLRQITCFGFGFFRGF
jgi:hypothetical protein